jgi:hypothetical protein
MRNKYSHRTSIEALENRIAPAGVVAIEPNGKSATWTDVDGDIVKMTVSKGILDSSMFTIDDSFDTGLLVEKFDIAGSVAFSGSKISVSSKRNPLVGGDGTVNVGYIDATDVSLASVTITGDLGRIDAGNPALAASPTKALGALTVYSLGALDGATLPGGVTQTSEIFGKVGTITVRGSVSGILFNVTGDDAGSIGSIKIGGSLVGTADSESGRISTTGGIGSIAIKGSIIGDAGQQSGSISARGIIKSVTIGGSIFGGRSDSPSTDSTGVIRSDASIGSVVVVGSIYGGTQQDSGLISSAGDITTVKIGGGIFGGTAGTSNGGIFAGGNVGSIAVVGNVVGGSAEESGTIRVDGKLAALTIKGSLLGGTANTTGSIIVGSDAGTLSIGGSVQGGDLSDEAADDLIGSALIQVKSAKAIKIGGSIVSGSDYSGANEIVNSATIRIAQNVGSLAIKGSILGNSETPVFITASGQEVVKANTDKDFAFGTIKVGGSVRHASILSGYGTDDVATEAEENPNAQISTVFVGGDWVASNLLSGARWSDSFGDGFDSKADGVDTPAITARISSITVVGQIIGTADSKTDQFRFMAQAIDKMTVGGSAVSLDIRKGNDNDLLASRYNLANTLDVRVFEFADVVN